MKRRGIGKSPLQAVLLSCGMVALLCAATDVGATDVEASATLGAGYTDNLGRDFDNKTSSEIGLVGVNFGLSKRTRKIDAYIRSGFQYLYYDIENFDSEVVGGGEARIETSLIEDHLKWTINDNYGQQLLDPFLPAQPTNRENVNYFSTGPTLDVPLGDRNLLNITGLYSNVNYETSPFDNTGWEAGIQLAREFRTDQLLSLNANRNATYYDNGGLSRDYDRYEYFARLDSHRGRNEVQVDVGYNELDFGLQETSGGGLIRITWERELSSASTLTLNGGSDYASQADRLRYVQANQREIGSTADVEGQDVPFRNDYFNVDYGHTRDRTTFDVGLEWNKEDYEGRSDRNRNIWRLVAYLRRMLSHKTYGEFGVQAVRREYSGLTRTDDDTDITLLFGVYLSPRVTLDLQYLFFNRNSNENTGEFTENRIFLNLSYTPKWGEKRN